MLVSSRYEQQRKNHQHLKENKNVIRIVDQNGGKFTFQRIFSKPHTGVCHAKDSQKQITVSQQRTQFLPTSTSVKQATER